MERIDLPGTEVGKSFSRRVLWRQALVGAVAFMVVALLAPWSLMLDSAGLSQLWRLCVEMGAIGVALSILLALPRVRAARAVFQRLALEPEKVEVDDVGPMAHLPFALTSRFIIAGALAAGGMAAPGIRPADLDDGRALSLALITFTIVCASAVVQYVAVRDATIRAIELSPIEPITAWLEREAMRMAPRQRVIRKILLAVVAPVALVGVGTLLVGQAQMRAFVDRDRTETAKQLAHTALDPIPGELTSGRDDAIAAAAAHGFFMAQQRGASLSSEQEQKSERLRGGQLRIAVAVEDGSATVRFTSELPTGVTSTGIWLALLAVALAALTGGAFGRTLASDLALATQQVSSLGTEVVLRGRARVAGPARFAVVAELGRSVEALAERFRVFAAASERALEVRASAQRMKQLLFASVSHDLKSPLNAILGFAELVRDEPLSQSQTENLDLVAGRGRELLALIETILDAARVEAGQLQLVVQPLPAAELLEDAIAKARDLHGPDHVDVAVDIAPDMPPIRIDPQHGARAVAVLIAHAMDTVVALQHKRIRVGVSPATDRPHMARLHIEYLADANRPSLLEAQLQGKLHASTGRGTVLRLSLSRAVVELHDGSVDVARGPQGTAVVACWLPLAPELLDDELPTARRTAPADPRPLDDVPTLVMRKK